MGRSAHGILFSHPTAADRAVAARMVERFGIAHLADRPYTMISGGERQLALLARALVPAGVAHGDSYCVMAVSGITVL